MNDMTKQDDSLLRAKINLETAILVWKELERFFAMGSIYVVSRKLDMVDVAVQISQDNAATVKKWLDDFSISKVSDEQALKWSTNNQDLWSVVVKPWILVQEIES